MRHTVDGTPLYSSRKNGVAHNMLKVAFLELDKYNESRDTELNAHWRQWLEFFGNRPFSHQPDQVIEQAESLVINPMGFNLVLNRDQLKKIIG